MLKQYIGASRKHGLSALEENGQNKYQEFGKSLLEQQHTQLATQLLVFQQALATFAKTHPNEIKDNEQFRKQFTELCFSVGVDPLAASLSNDSNDGLDSGSNNNQHGNKSLWSRLLNNTNEEYYNQLAVTIYEAFQRFQNRVGGGGIISMNELYGQLTAPNSPNSIAGLTRKDIRQSVKLLNTLNPNLQIITIKDQEFIKFADLSNYEKNIFEVCNLLGYCSLSILVANYNWNSHHAKDVLDSMVSQGFLWVDQQTDSNEYHYWDPSWINKAE